MSVSATAPTSAMPAVLHRIRVLNAHAHLFEVELHLSQPAAQQRVSMPVWIPGSYLVREFARHSANFSATQAGQAIAVEQLDKHSWQLDCVAEQPVTLRYEVYAFDNSVRTAWLDTARGFFNPTSLCLRADGLTDAPQHLEVCPPTHTHTWQLAVALDAAQPNSVNAQGFGTYVASDYDELADSPVEMGAFWSGEFEACGIPHRFVVAGAYPSFDGAKLLADTQRICETAIRFWHPEGQPAPFKRYTFLLNAVENGYGGLEHRASTALICGQRDLPVLNETKVDKGYTTLLGLISHEYFHTWNVKRLRPAEFARYNYDQENYTELLWFFEGFTSYYDDLLLRRAGLIDNATYLGLLSKTLNQVQQTPGRLVQSVAQSSFDAWVKYYRMDENTPNATVSYYTKGSLVALCFDLSLRLNTPANLDAVMRTLWERTQGGPMREADFAQALHDLGGRDFAAELAHWVHSTQELPLQSLLQGAGVDVQLDPTPMEQSLGLRCVAQDGGLRIKTVLRGGPAEQAGLAAGDDWLGIRLPEQADGGAWRLRQIDELAALAGAHTHITAVVGRGARLLHLPLHLPAPSNTVWRLSEGNANVLNAWLQG